MGMEAHSSEELKGMLESCIKGNNFTMEREIKDVLNSRNVPDEKLLESDENKFPSPDLEFGWPSSSG